MQKLEIKYDQKYQDINKRKNDLIQNNEIFSEYWLRVLTNNKLINDFITAEDREVLKHLKNVSYLKFEDGNVIIVFIILSLIN
jgi:hypothetical protein